MKKCFISAVCLFIFFQIKADEPVTGDHGGRLPWSIQDSTLTISGEGSMDIDDNSDWRYEWNSHGSKIKRVIISEGITTIGHHAFADCPNLDSVKIPEGIISIGEYAFEICYSLRSITLPNSITSVSIGIFNACISLKTVKLPDNLIELNEGDFHNCHSLTEINLPSTLISIGNDCFAECWSLTSVVIPEGVESIGSFAFIHCVSLTSVTLPASLTAIGNECFCECNSLISVKTYNPIPQVIEENVFAFVPKEDAILFVPQGSKAAYEDADVWKEFGTLIVGEYFDLTESLALNKTELFLEVGDSVKLIATLTPLNSSLLQPPVWRSSNEDIATVTQDGTVTLNKSGRAIITAKSGNRSATCKVEDQTTKVDGTIEGSCGDNIIYTFKDSVLTLTGTGSTWDYDLVSTGEIDDKSIPPHDELLWWSKSWVTDSPFETFDSLIAKVVVGEGITNLGDWITSGLYNVTSFELPTTLKSAGFGTFAGSKIKSINLPDSMFWLLQSAFCGCPFLEHITLPKTIDNLQSYMFAYCTNLKSIQVLNPIPPVWHTADVFTPGLERKNITLIIPKNTRQDFLNANNGINSATGLYVWRGFKAITEPLELTEFVDGQTGEMIQWDSIIALKIHSEGTGNEVQVQLNLLPEGTYYDRINFTGSNQSVVRVYREEGDPLNTAWLSAKGDVVDTVTITATVQPYGTRYEFQARSYNVISEASAIEVFTGDYQHTLSPVFKPRTLEYTVAVDPEHESITINPIPLHARATTSPLTTDIPYGTSEHEVTVQAEHWDYKTTYKITVTRPKPNTVALQTLATNPIRYKFDVPYGELNQEFFVEWDIDSIEVIPELGEESETINHAVYPLNLGENIIRIPVIRPDNTVRWEYVIKITRLMDNDATLKFLTVDTFTLTPTFSPTTFKYYLTVPNEVRQVTLKAEGNGYVSYIFGTGQLLLDVGKQKQPIIVYAMDKTKKTYCVEITREAPESPATGLEKVRNEHNVYREGSTLWIDTPASERIIIYSINGTKLYCLEKLSGKASLVINRPDRILIVKGSSGWVMKVVM